MRKLIAIPIISAALWAGLPLTSYAAALHPPQAKATAGCTAITIDPQPGQEVRFTGTIGGHTVSLVAHHVPGTHISTADDSAFTTATGPITVDITPQWTIGPNPYGVTSGPGVELKTTLVCHEPKPTTTTTTSTSTSTSTTSTTMHATTTTTVMVPTLPRTGAGSLLWPSTVVGATLVALGSWLRRFRKAGRA